jgi:tRNA threonylcarbamoyladenosine biosynthesis protein TsaE
LVVIEATLRGVESTVELGRRLGRGLEPGDVVLLEGALGAGKTVLVRGIVAGIDPEAEALVSSPTYVVVGEYPTRPRVVHMDLYRLGSVAEVRALGFEELIYGANSIAVVEWPALLEGLLEEDDAVLRVRLAFGEGPDERRVALASAVPRLVRLGREALLAASGDVVP